MADLVRSDVEAYAEAHTTPLPAALERLYDEAVVELPYPSMLSGPVVGRLLETLVFALRPKLVVEVGTYAGLSALAMAGALPPGGRIVTLELEDAHADFAQRHVDASAYADRIEIVRGPALASLERLDGPFDFVFIDADKIGYPDYYEAALAKLAPTGVIAVDNTLRDGGALDPDSDGDRAIAALNDRWVADERVIATQLTVRDGVTLLRPR
jgi:caffeoyl-CoA O-methyltransferase